MIRTAFVFDDSGYHPSIDDEVKIVVDELALIGIFVEIAQTASNMMEVYRGRFELLVIDYGGLSTMGGSHAGMQVWSACKYAEDHPGSLVVLWSKFTERIYRGELEAEFGLLDNVLLRYAKEESGYEKTERFNAKIQAWFGVGNSE